MGEAKEAAVDPATRDMERSGDKRENLTVTVPTDLLQAVRQYKGRIQISQVVEAALRDKLEEVSQSERQRVLRRLQLERDERRGPTYERGYREGERWAKFVASWRELSEHAMYHRDSVQVEERERYDEIGLEFVGSFHAPAEDYPNAPYVAEEADSFSDEPALRASDKYSCERYWRGWLAGVSAVYEMVRGELEDDIPF